MVFAAFGNLSEHSFPFIRKGDDGRSSPAAAVIGNDLNRRPIQNSNTRIGSTQINADYFAHCAVNYLIAGGQRPSPEPDEEACP